MIPFAVSILVQNLSVLVLAGFTGYLVISKVPNTLHTPLMSATNAIHGIVLLGGLYLIGPAEGFLNNFLLVIAIAFGTISRLISEGSGFVRGDDGVDVAARVPVGLDLDPARVQQRHQRVEDLVGDDQVRRAIQRRQCPEAGALDGAQRRARLLDRVRRTRHMAQQGFGERAAACADRDSRRFSAALGHTAW